MQGNSELSQIICKQIKVSHHIHIMDTNTHILTGPRTHWAHMKLCRVLCCFPLFIQRRELLLIQVSDEPPDPTREHTTHNYICVFKSECASMHCSFVRLNYSLWSCLFIKGFNFTLLFLLKKFKVKIKERVCMCVKDTETLSVTSAHFLISSEASLQVEMSSCSL